MKVSVCGLQGIFKACEADHHGNSLCIGFTSENFASGRAQSWITKANCQVLWGEHGDVVPAAATAGVAAQKKTLHASERDTEPVRQARIVYCAQLSPCPAERLKYVDEAGIHIAMSRRFGRAPKGQRVQDAVPKNWGKNVTLLDGLSCQGWKPS